MSSTNITTIIPKLHRPVFDGIDSFEECMKVAMQEYEGLKETDEQGLSFANKTAMWIAYERFVESSRSDALFYDPLAQYLMEPYGKRLSDCMSIGLTYQVFDPPPSSSVSPVPKLSDVGANLGFGLEGHVLYTAARTKLINIQIGQWTNMQQQQQQQQIQVVNLGAGFDTRPYWLSSLQNANCRYWEIDTESVQTYKRAALEKLHKKEFQPLCPSVCLSADLSDNSVETVLLSNDDDQSFTYHVTIPTCWIAEGLIMYLSREAVIQLMESICKLSASKSLFILNFATNTPQGPSIDEIREILESKNWKQTQRLYFGQEGFHFQRYPPNKPANKILGVATFVKQ